MALLPYMKLFTLLGDLSFLLVWKNGQNDIGGEFVQWITFFSSGKWHFIYFCYIEM